MLPLLILVPLSGLLVLNLPPGRILRRVGWLFVLLNSLAQVAVVLLAPAAAWTTVSPLDRFFTFNLDGPNLTRVLLLSIGIVVCVTVLLGRALVAGERHRWQFLNLLLLALVGMNGAVLVTDLFSLYVFLEITSVASFILIAFNRQRDGLEGAFQYMVQSAVATVLMVTGIALLLLVTGSTSFAGIKAGLGSSGRHVLATMAVGAFLCGLFIKGGLVPFHGWLPGAYSAAPAAASVLLAGIVTKVSGIYALLRLTTSVFAPSATLNNVLLLVGAVSIVIGALAALRQTDLKRMLAYSSISQVGYIVLGLGCGTPLGMAGAVFHLFNHAIFKTLLFVNSAALEQRLQTTDMNRMSGLGSRMPVTGATSLVAALSTAGVPPLGGFWSKLIIVIALWQSQDYCYAGLAVLLSVVTLGYLLLMQRRIFFGPVRQEFAQVREAGLALVLPEVALAALTVGVGLAFPWVLNTFMLPVAGLQ